MRRKMGQVERERMTRQRQVILETLKGMHTHPDAAAVYEAVRKTLPRISLGTVYRNLEALYRAGLISKVGSVGARMHFDGNVTVHCHVQCVKCGSIVDADLNGIDALAQSVSEAPEFEITEQRVGFVGLCPRCARKNTHKVSRRKGGGGRGGK